MRKNVLLLIVSLALGFTACNKVKTDTSSNGDFTVDTDIAALQQRLTILDEPVVFNTNKSTQATLVANWNLAPHFYAKTDDGLNNYEFLSASSVAEDGNGHVYVGFHDRGDLWFGEVVQVDETAGTNITGAVHSNVVDVNDLEINGTTIYIAGESRNRGAEALKMSLTAGSGVLVTPSGVGMPIWGASGNSVTLVGSKLWVSAGGSNNANMHGGLAILDLGASPADPVYLVEQDNGKHFDADNDYGLWIQGNNPSQTNLYIYQNLSTGGTTEYRDGTNSLPKLPFPVTAFGKNAVDVDGDVAYVAMGASGVFRVELATANTPGDYTRYFNSGNLGFANGVATDGYFVYVANGADGLIVLSMDLQTEIGRWNGTTRSTTTSDDNGSCNYVAVAGAQTDATSARELFVAFGRGGLTKITFTS